MDLNSGNKDIDLAVQEIEQKIVIRDNSKSNNSDVPEMVKYVMGLSGGALSSKQAAYILVLFVAILFGITAYLFLKVNAVENRPPVPLTVEGPNFGL